MCASLTYPDTSEPSETSCVLSSTVRLSDAPRLVSIKQLRNIEQYLEANNIQIHRRMQSNSLLHCVGRSDKSIWLTSFQRVTGYLCL